MLGKIIMVLIACSMLAGCGTRFVKRTYFDDLKREVTRDIDQYM
jgi:hypothetical protein